jgi:hypothetical protein
MTVASPLSSFIEVVTTATFWNLPIHVILVCINIMSADDP